MRSMFLKLFLSFWLVLILGGAVSVTIFFTFQNHSNELFKKDMFEKLDTNLAKLIVLSGRAAQQIYICGGKTEYENYINGLVEGAHTRIFLIGDDNQTITGAEVPKELLTLAEKARKNTEASIQKSGDILTVAKSLETNSTKPTVVVGIHTIGPPPGMPAEGKDWRNAGHPLLLHEVGRGGGEKAPCPCRGSPCLAGLRGNGLPDRCSCKAPTWKDIRAGAGQRRRYHAGA